MPLALAPFVSADNVKEQLQGSLSAKTELYFWVKTCHDWFGMIHRMVPLV